MDDSEILVLYWQRSEEAIRETEAKYKRYCTYIAANILPSAADAEECVNDTWLRAWNAIPPAKPKQLATYLGKITRNLAINQHEKQHAAKRGLGQMPLALSELEDCVSSSRTPEQMVEDARITEALNQFLRELPITSRRVFVRRYWYLSSIDDIAKEYAMSASKVKSMLFRLREKLRDYLEKEGISL